MPLIDGKVHRSRFTSLKLGELSCVDNPAQIGARMAIMKRHEPDRASQLAEVAKYVCDDDGAHTFTEVLAENKFSQEVWPCVDALSQSIRSIVGDTSLAGGDREAKISASVEQFLSAVRDISPDVSKQLSELVRKKEGPMPKTVEQLETELATAKAATTDAEKARDSAITERDAAVTAKAAAETERDAAKAEGGELATVKAELVTTKAALTAATDQTLKVGDVEVKKSEVGDAQFRLTKGLQDEATLARLEKRAGEEFAHVVGTSAEKALVLKSVHDLPEDNPTRKALEAILTSAEKMTAAGFDRLGGGGGQTPTEKAAQATFKQKVKEIAKRDDISEHAAMSKARSEFPDEFATAYPDSAPAEQPAN